MLAEPSEVMVTVVPQFNCVPTLEVPQAMVEGVAVRLPKRPVPLANCVAPPPVPTVRFKVAEPTLPPLFPGVKVGVMVQVPFTGSAAEAHVVVYENSEAFEFVIGDAEKVTGPPVAVRVTAGHEIESGEATSGYVPHAEAVKEMTPAVPVPLTVPEPAVPFAGVTVNVSVSDPTVLG